MNHGIFRNSGISHVTQATTLTVQDRVVAVVGDSRKPVRTSYVLTVVRAPEHQVDEALDELTEGALLDRASIGTGDDGQPVYEYRLTERGRRAYRTLKRPDREEPPPS